MKANVPVKAGVTTPALWAFDPFTSLRREMDRMFDEFRSGFGRFWPELPSASLSSMTPTMDVTETEKEYEVTAELPGLEEKDVDITVADGMLVIRGEKKIDHEEKGKDFHVVERRYGSFSRSLELPAGVDASTIKATLEKGVLSVSIPKKAADVKKIEVMGTEKMGTEKKEMKAAA
jgi:HSP20 family protein